MKKLLISLCLVLASISLLSAQDLAYRQGDKIINVGTSFLNGYMVNATGANRIIGFPPLLVSGELGFHEYVSAGIYAGFSNTRWRRNLGNSSTTFPINTIGAGVRVSFHFWGLLADALAQNLEEDKIDVYITLSSGLYVGANYDPALTDSPDINMGLDNLFGANFGFRYYFNKNLGVYLETGRTFTSYSNAGLAFKF